MNYYYYYYYYYYCYYLFYDTNFPIAMLGGLVFIKPLVFIPSENIASISAGRGGSGNTRYVDLQVDIHAQMIPNFVGKVLSLSILESTLYSLSSCLAFI